LTQQWTGSPLVTGSTDPTFDPNTEASVVTTAVAEETVYIKANLIGQTQTVTKQYTFAVCDSSIEVKLAGLSEYN
jgi:hypothetical protein